MELYEFDCFQFDTKNELLRRDGVEVKLAPVPTRLLLVFLKAGSDVVLSSERLREEGLPGRNLSDSNLNTNLYYVRRALGSRANGEEYIKYRPKKGYFFTAEISRVSLSPVPSPAPPTPREVPAEEKRELPQIEVQPRSSRWSLIRRWVGPAILTVVGILAVAGAFRPRPSPHILIKAICCVAMTRDGLSKGALLTDGLRVYFGEERPSDYAVASVPIEGGGVGVVPLALSQAKDERIEPLDVAPRSSEILAVRLKPPANAGELWVVPMLGGSPRRIGDIRASHAKWSHDRKRIAFTLDDKLYLANVDGSGVQRIAALDERLYEPRWSPDEKKLRFDTQTYSNGDARQSLWEVNVDGTGLHQLLPDWNKNPHECCGVWTPDGTFYVFQAMHGEHTNLWAIDERPGTLGWFARTPFQLTVGPMDLQKPAISGDGKRLFAVGAQELAEVARYDVGLRQFVRILGVDSPLPATWVTYSPTGRFVAYVNYPDGTVWRAGADGSKKEQITFAPLQAEGLAWSPNEKWLAIRARKPGKNWRIYLMPAAGGEPKMMFEGEEEQGVPSWSPDGLRICYGDVPGVFGKPVGTEKVHVFDLRTGAISDLPNSSGLWTARWSPDGRYISALTIEGQRLTLFNVQNKKWVATEAVNVNNPNWSTNSKEIYYDTVPSDRTLRRLRLGDGKVEQLADLHNFATAGPWWSGLAPDNSPILLRKVDSTEVYSLDLEYK